MIVGLMGNIGSGKDTVAEILIKHHGFTSLSFADALKDTASVIFGWSRELLEGKSSQSRQWREQVDHWWAEKLGIEHLTPRWVLQQLGTNVMRTHFHSEIWVATVERKIRDCTGPVVVTDIRFPNEAQAVIAQSGTVWHVHRGETPEWWNLAVTATTEQHPDQAQAQQQLAQQGVHPSEWNLAGIQPHCVIHNTGTLEDLRRTVEYQLNHDK